jgi:hypothetical protein
MTLQLSPELANELSARQKLVFEACQKIQQANKLFEEGRIELANLLSEKLVRKDAKGPDTSNFKLDIRNDEDLKEKMVELIKVNRQASTKLFADKLRISDRRLDRLLEGLVKSGTIEDIGSGGRHAWIMVAKKLKPVKKPKKTFPKKGHISSIKINGRRLASNKHHSSIDVTDEKLQEKVISFLKTHDWVNKGQLINAIDMSFYPGNRLLEYMQKHKLIKQVAKKNNPAHESRKSLFVQEFPYWEVV